AGRLPLSFTLPTTPAGDPKGWEIIFESTENSAACALNQHVEVDAHELMVLKAVL
ncbi:hypothetical protein IH824_11635, partial [candidate division KSB1 bacterium]|nr:hypothetical protein [candidate division KSB1 bacterium]